MRTHTSGSLSLRTDRTSPLVVPATQTFYSDLHITAYNVVFTAWPVLARAVMEVDVPDAVAARFPELYRAGALDQYLSRSTLTKSIALGTAHAVLLTVIPLQLFQNSGPVARNGDAGDVWMAGVASFFYVLWIAHLQIFFETWSWSRLVTLTYLTSMGISIVCICVIDQVDDSIRGIAHTIFTIPRYWLGLSLATVACMAPWIAFKWCVLCSLLSVIDLLLTHVLGVAAVRRTLARPTRCTCCGGCGTLTRSWTRRPLMRAPRRGREAPSRPGDRAVATVVRP